MVNYLAIIGYILLYSGSISGRIVCSTTYYYEYYCESPYRCCGTRHCCGGVGGGSGGGSGGSSGGGSSGGSSGGGGGMSAGTIVGIVFGCIFGLGVLMACCSHLCTKCDKQSDAVSPYQGSVNIPERSQFTSQERGNIFRTGTSKTPSFQPPGYVV